MSLSEARQKALDLSADFEFEPTSLVTYRAGGKILVIGDASALQHCDELPAGLDLQPLDIGDKKFAIDGYLGSFAITVTDTHGNQVVHQGDAVLDLHATAHCTSEMLPPGYFHLPPQRQGDVELLAELDELVGEFEKPKYFDYDASICAHAVNGKVVCRQCIDACPADAIQSLGERIEVNANLCQGGGTCTTVCPSGAIRYLYPNLRDNGRRLRDLLKIFLDNGGQQPIVLFHAASQTPDAYVDSYPGLLPVAVEELGGVGMDLCLSALAYGAHQVILLVDDDVPASTGVKLQQQLDWVHALLAELSLDAACIALCENGAGLPECADRIALDPAIYDTPPAKRSTILLALDHLVATRQPQAQQVALPASAPFGEVVIDAGKCTLCMACVGSCPGRALQDGSNREVPEVFFVESNCLQCGACVQTCPEDAMHLVPRLLFDPETRKRARALNRDTPFACISCAKPFAPTSAVNKMQDKLKDHYMFNTPRALDRLKMCEDCRVVDIVQDPEAMGGGQFNPHKRFQ